MTADVKGPSGPAGDDPATEVPSASAPPPHVETAHAATGRGVRRKPTPRQRPPAPPSAGKSRRPGAAARGRPTGVAPSEGAAALSPRAGTTPPPPDLAASVLGPLANLRLADLAPAVGRLAALATATGGTTAGQLLKEGGRWLKGVGGLAQASFDVGRELAPLLKLMARPDDITPAQLGVALDQIFAALARHPVTAQAEEATAVLRRQNLLPNEQSTEGLIRFLVEQVLARSPVPVPEALVGEFWTFFDELLRQPELKGLGIVGLDMARLVLRTYEPLLADVLNLLKASRRFNQQQLGQALHRGAVVAGDVAIMRRQAVALRYVKDFFATDPKDFGGQAKIVASMVREFGPFFIKMAQVAAANADFLPAEIARELAVFHEDVPPMRPEEVMRVLEAEYGFTVSQRFYGLDPAHPLKSGSIGSVFVARRPVTVGGVEHLEPVIVKVGRAGLDREFAIGRLVLNLAIQSSQYWAPHSRLAPFLVALQEQIDEFVAGFEAELDFSLEARHHRRFEARARYSRRWRVPHLIGAGPQVIEMEYLQHVVGLPKALQRSSGPRRDRLRRQLLEDLLVVVLVHVLRYREVHGDLHPGNILLDRADRLYLIDWGNVVDLRGKLRPVGRYLLAALLADTPAMTAALISLSTRPEADAARQAEIRAALDDTLRRKGVGPLALDRRLPGQLRREGRAGLRRRFQALLQLMSNTQQVGLVLHRDYLHLSRAVAALAGSLGSLYVGTTPRHKLLDLVRLLGWRLPRLLPQELLLTQVRETGSRLRAFSLRARLSDWLQPPVSASAEPDRPLRAPRPAA